MTSSVIRDFAYDPDNAQLAVRFVSGRIYVYQGVPAVIAAGLGRAESMGRYFNAAIRDRFAFARAPTVRDAMARALTDS